ncbi:hypothetical protein ACJX0J_013061, partial [Zea mays]
VKIENVPVFRTNLVEQGAVPFHLASKSKHSLTRTTNAGTHIHFATSTIDLNYKISCLFFPKYINLHFILSKHFSSRVSIYFFMYERENLRASRGHISIPFSHPQKLKLLIHVSLHDLNIMPTSIYKMIIIIND